MGQLEEFIKKIDKFETFPSSLQCDYFLYYLTEVVKKDDVAAKDIELCFSSLKLHKYSNIPVYLKQNSVKKGGKKPKFLKLGNGFQLERQKIIELRSTVFEDKHFTETENTLRTLLDKITNHSEKEFLLEAIKCFEVEAFRASMILVWLLTIDHLYEFILLNKVGDFNAELMKVTDKRIKVSMIVSKDGFADIPEGKFIELCRASQIITNDIRKILDTKLGIRNSIAHPSTITIGRGKAFEFIEDLVHNVILKF
jgi:hypothetical protein